MNTSLDGKVVLVTGAGSGLGEATARTFANAGARVACLDINFDNARRVADSIGEDKAAAYGVNVADAQAINETVTAIVERLGRLDVVVSAAAVDHVKPVSEMTVEQWDQVIGVNLRGPFLVAKAALPHMQRQGGGYIINVASTAATRAWANASAYHASKWGLVGFGRSLGVEGRAHNIRVTTIIPGGMRTHFFDRFPEQGIPMPDMTNLQDPANVAATILFAVLMPADSVMQEVIVTPLTETSWP